MSKQDSHFFNIFGVVLGILITVALVLIGFSRAVGRDTQGRQVLQEGLYVESVEARIAPPVRVAVAGQDNNALAILPIASAVAAPALAIPADAVELYAQVCATCHDGGIGGAPKIGDVAAWGPRIAQGNDTLYRHAVEGYTGPAGVMPAKGGRIDLSDDLIRAGVDHMVTLSR